jgi:hypothetical protein
MTMMRMLLIGAIAGALPTVGLAAGSEPTASATGTAADPDADKIICRKRAEVGSLVRKKKECFTKAEWNRIAESQQQGTRRMHDELIGGMRCDPAVQSC